MTFCLRRTVLHTVLALFVASTALSACGGSDSTSSASGTTTTAKAAATPTSGPAATEPSKAVDVCSLFTDEDVSAAVGTAVTAHNELGDIVGAPHCFWSTVLPITESSTTVEIKLDPGAKSFAATKNMAGKPGFGALDPVSGVGDEAFFEAFLGPETPRLRMKKGSDAYNFLVQSGTTSPDQRKAAETTIAKQAAAGL